MLSITTILESSFASSDVFMLTGSAGTGKTTLIHQIVTHLNAQGKPCVLMAPTGRAAKVLTERTGFPASTIHKAIYEAEALREHLDAVGEPTTFKWVFNLATNLDNADTVYIVDEASMVSDTFSEQERFRFGSGYLLSDLMQFVDLKATNNNRKIIFVGDSAQLPPVGSSFSPALSKQYLQKTFDITVSCHELTKNFRQLSGSGILDNALRIRKGIDQNHYAAFQIQPFTDTSLLATVDFIQHYSQITACKPDPDVLIVAYSNEKVRRYNATIRQRLFPAATGPVSGDIMLVVRNNYLTRPALFNGDFVKLHTISDETTKQTASFKVKDEERVQVTLAFRQAVISLLDEDETQEVLLIEDLLDSNDPSLSDVQQDALYVNFKMRHPHLKPGSDAFIEIYKNDPYVNAVQVKYGYAATCHKAQGGEWKTVFVDYSWHGAEASESYFRWAYTATTRPKEHLYALNAPNRTVLDTAKPIFIDIQSSLAESRVIESADKEKQAYPVAAAIEEALTEAGITTKEITHHRYRDYFFVDSKPEPTRISVDYNSKNEITRIGIDPAQSPIAEMIHAHLDALVGTRILVKQQQAPKTLPESTACELPEHLAEFNRNLVAAAKEIDVNIQSVRPFSDHQIRYGFEKEGHTCTLDYYLNKKGIVSNIQTIRKQTTNPELINRILSLTKGAYHD